MPPEHPFEKFFRSTFKAIPGVDRNTNAQLEQLARKSYAECWNQAIEQAAEATNAGNPEASLYGSRIRALKVSQ